MKGDNIMKRLFDRIAMMVEMSYAVTHIRYDQPARSEDFIAMKENYENKSK
jgi:hypothetical protein